MGKTHYTITEIAERLGVTYQRVTQIIAAGHLKTRRIGRTKYFVRIPAEELERYEEWRAMSLDEREALQ